MIVGSLLGDGRLECRSNGTHHSKTARFRVHHGAKQERYVQWKYEQLKDLVDAPPRSITRFDQKRDAEETSWYFHTRSMPELGVLHEWFYPKGPKCLPVGLEQILTPRMLAIWYMDDGSWTGASCTLSTHSLNAEEQRRTRDILLDQFGVQSTLVKDRHQYKIAIGVRSVSAFMRVIIPHVIAPMSYKIVYPRNDLFFSENRVAAQGGILVVANTSVAEKEYPRKV